MSLQSEIERIELGKGAINDHLSSLGVPRGGTINDIATNITVLQRPTGNAGQFLGFIDDNTIGAVDAPSVDGGFSEAYIVGSTPFAEDWLSGTQNGTAITPEFGETRVVMSEGEHSRMLYKYNGTRWVPVGAKVNILPYMSDIVHNVGNVSAPVRTTVTVCRFRPSVKTTKITIRGSVSLAFYGGAMSYGIENEDMRSRANTASGAVNDTFLFEEGEKENDFIITLSTGSPYSDVEITWLTNCVVTESNGKYEYTYNFTTKKLFNNETHESQAGLVPAIPDEVGESGVLLSDGTWHTKESAAEILDELPITREEISQAFGEAYGNLKPTNNVYSLEESVIGTWIDGKPLYRKVVEATLAKNRSNIGVADLSIDKLISCKFISYTYDGGYSRSARPDAQTSFFMSSATSITCDNNSGGVLAGALAVEYTKTTDSPTTQSKVPFEPLVEYSLDEKLVGYFCDQKPIYRKTVYVANPTSGNILVENVDTLVSVTGSFKHASKKYLFPYHDGSYACYTFTQVNNSNILNVAIDRFTGITDLYATVEYTRVTD